MVTHSNRGRPRRWWEGVRDGARTWHELLRGLWRGPHWWLAPLVFLLLPTAILFICLKAVPLVAPFVYTLF
jgi:hypothetical protein